jgi:hypothetical protein
METEERWAGPSQRGMDSIYRFTRIPRPACHEHVEWEATDHLCFA